jgi:hypothetical protein
MQITLTVIAGPSTGDSTKPAPVFFYRSRKAAVHLC